MKVTRKRRKIAATLGVALCIAFCIAVASVVALSSSGGGEWGYQRELVMYEQSGDLLTDYQVLVELTGSNFPANAQTDGNDIRFTDSGGSELSYWIEDYDYSGKSAKVWVKVPSIPASDETTVTMWYGNPSASEVSEGDEVFEFFDDFEGSDIDTSKWVITVEPGAGYSVGNSILEFWGADGPNFRLKSHDTFTSAVLGAYATLSADSKGSGIEIDGYKFQSKDATDRGIIVHEIYVGGVGKIATNAFTPDIWYRFTVKRDVYGDATYYVDGVEKASAEVTYTAAKQVIVDTEAAGHSYIDWTFVRKYASTEPTLSIGAEQSTTKVPSLTITKSVSSSTIAESETATITVKVGNRGSADATNVEVIDSVPGAFALVSGSLTQRYDTLKPTEYRTYQYTVEATETGSFVTDVATATYEDDDGSSYSSVSNSVTITVESETAPTPTSTPTPSTPTPSTPTPSTPTLTPTPSTPKPISEPTEEPELSISQSSLKEEPEVGEDILITVAILNKGKGTAQNIRLVENIPSSIAVNYVEGGEKAGSLVYWNGELDSGEAHSITHTLRILEEKNLIIPVTVTYEDASGTEHQQSAEIYLTAETPTQPSTDSTPAFELPDLSWPYLIILVAVVFGGIAIIVAVRRRGGDGGAEVTIEEKSE